MSAASSMSADTRNKAIGIVAFVAVAGGILYYELFGDSAPNPAAHLPVAAAPALNVGASDAPAGQTQPAAASSGASTSEDAARKASGSTAKLDPALHMEAMRTAEQVEYSGVGRNIFSPNSAPPIQKIPTALAPARPGPSQVLQPPVHTGPPPPPPIDLTFFGTMTDSAGKRQAMLLHQGGVYTAQAGDVVLRRYRIVSIDARSIQVEDMLTNNKQTLPLVAN